MKWRDALKTFGVDALAATTDCLDSFEQQSAWRNPPLVDDRPDVVYLPTATERIKMYRETITSPCGVMLTYSYPHCFWTVAGPDLGKTVVEADDSIHLMASLWDAGTGIVLPLDTGVSIEILRDDDLVSEEVTYLMFLQQMEMHYGLNYVLDGEGGYKARVRIGGTSLSRTGSFAGQFESAKTATLGFTSNMNDPYDVGLRYLGDEAGSRGAAPAMEVMGVPTGKAPAVSNLPGRHLDRQTSADALSDAFVANDGSRFGIDGAYPYVLARTSRNESVLPIMGVRATLERNGATTLDDAWLARILDPDLNYHYGTDVRGVESGGTLTLLIDMSPQVAHHDGYETTFTASEPTRFEV